MPHLKSEFLKISWNDVIPKSPNLLFVFACVKREENLGANRLPCGSALESEHGMDGLPHTHTPYQPSNCEKGRLTYSAQKQTAGVVFISYRQWQPRTSCLVRRCPQTWEKWYENGNGKPPFKKLFKVLHPRMFRFKWGKTAFRSRMVAEFSRLVHVAVLKQFQAAIHAFQNGRNATGCRWCCGISKM